MKGPEFFTPEPIRTEAQIAKELEEAKQQIRDLNEAVRHGRRIDESKVADLEERIRGLEVEQKALREERPGMIVSRPVEDAHPRPSAEDMLELTGPAPEDETPEPAPPSGPPEPPQPPEPPRDPGPLGDIPVPVPGVNPDRVRFVDREVERDVVVTPARTERTERVVSHWGRPTVRYQPNGSARTWFSAAAATALIGTVVSNLGVEHERGSPVSATAEGVRQALGEQDMDAMATQVSDQVCGYLANPEFMHRFAYRDRDGSEQWNPGAAILPFAVQLSRTCRARVDVQVHIPYHFARTFSEINAANPERRAELIRRLSEFVSREVQSQLQIRGIAGVTGTELVYNRAYNTLSNRVDLGRLDITDMVLTGEASAEAEASTQNAGVESLRGRNPENEALALNRLNDSLPLIREALANAGVSADTLRNVQTVSFERNLVDSQVQDLARIARRVLGDSVESDDAMAYQLVQEINGGNTAAIAALAENPEEERRVRALINDNRGVDLAFTASTEYEDKRVFNVAFPWPLLLLMLPWLRFGWTGRFKEVVTGEKSVPEVWGTELVNMPEPVARRLFSEATPMTLNKERSFNDVYESVDLGKNPRDTHLLLEHMLIEEVLPSLYEDTKEPMIDYEEIVNASREFLSSDARKGEMAKGSHPTTKEAEMKTAELLLSMWERHDAATYPMEGIDISTVLNYRYSPHVVYWAKALSEFFVSIANETVTRDEFRNRLITEIDRLKRQRAREGGQDLNLFVQSRVPLGR